MKRILIILSAAICLIGGVLVLSLINGSSIFRKNVDALAQQEIRICGHVQGEDGLPIIGASIIEVGTTNGTLSDYDGLFCIIQKGDGYIEISCIGYKTVRVKYEGKPLNITLKEDTEDLVDL